MMRWSAPVFATIFACLFSTLPASSAPLASLIEAAILGEENEGLPEGARLEIYLPHDAPAEANRLIAAEYDLTKAKYVVLAEPLTGGQIQIRGRVFAVIDAPVPRESILPGSPLSADQFEIRSFPLTAIGRFAVTSLDDLEGAEARRTLPAGRLVQSQSLQVPRAVRRGEKLTLIYHKGQLELNVPARALEDGGAGDMIRVQNLSSNKTLNAIALGDGRVQVSQ